LLQNHAPTRAAGRVRVLERAPTDCRAFQFEIEPSSLIVNRKELAHSLLGLLVL
jgi:hypothetical protein